MKASEINQPRTRWSLGQRLQGESALMEGTAFPFGKTCDHLIDMRGIEITEIIKNATINFVDLSGSKLEGFGQFAKCNIEKTRFNFASLGTNIGNNFLHCDFVSAKAIGAVLRGQFVDCNFIMANLSGARGSQVKFVRCVFYKTNFSRVVLLHSTFEDCNFKECKFSNGSLSYSKFIRSPIREDDLKNALMEKVQFISEV